jgi:hypothetical protein
MTRPVRIQTLSALSAAVLTLIGSPQSIAQPASRTPVLSAPDEVTTVSPLVVRGMAPVPEIGAGATYFTVEELQKVAHDARDARQAAELDEATCGGINRGFLQGLEDNLAATSNLNPGLGASAAVRVDTSQFTDAERRSGEVTNAAVALERAGDTLGAEATYAAADTIMAAAVQAVLDARLKARQDAVEGTTGALNQMYLAVRVYEGRVEQAATTAQAATEAALAARRAATPDDATAAAAVNRTELARQAAIKALQQAQAQAAEAHLRVADLQDQIDQATGGDPSAATGNASQFMAYVDEQTRRRSFNGGYTGIYVADEFKDLRLINIVSRSVTVRGKPTVRVTGKIVNTRRKAIRVPPLWVAAVDRFGTSLYNQQAAPPPMGTTIPSRDSRPFVFDLASVPEKTVKTVVTFAPVRRAPVEKASGVYCGGSRPPEPIRDPSRTDQLYIGPIQTGQMRAADAP